jgi:DNA-binding response OmpR family regulator
MMEGEKIILVVEDEEKIRNVISLYLKKEGFKVYETGDGQEAITLTEKVKPDLIILDIMLPGISGYEICRRIKSNEETKNIIIVILSAKGQEWEKSEGYNVGADLYETKPFSPKQLISSVKSIINKSQSFA